MFLAILLILLRIIAALLIGSCVLLGARIFIMMVIEYYEGDYNGTVLGCLIGYGLCIAFGIWLFVQVLP